MTGLPADGHVHSEWSWDAATGSMERSCARAVAIGLPVIAFTEHVDHTVWNPDLDELHTEHPVTVLTGADGRLVPPAFDVEGYLASVERCRALFPRLRVLSGVELGEPHRHADQVRRVLAAGRFDRVLGSLHSLPDGDVFHEPPSLFARHDPVEVVERYLAEVVRLVECSDAFAVLAHVDYPLRHWSPAAGLDGFEDAFREVLRVTARTGRALEINTVLPLDATILRWWHAEGGQAVTFGSDAHDPAEVARGFADAARLAEAHGFTPGADPLAFWSRSG
ncbi:PHP domain-containing protein [soil metagenome]